MYGFLRPVSKYLSKEANQAYSRMYCGQCVALHDHFGYLSRTVASYDATFFGLLLSAQQEDTEAMDRRRCAVFPVKKEIVSPEEPATHFSAALAVTLSAIKLKDKQQERYSSIRRLMERSLRSTTIKARDILSNYGVPGSLIEKTLCAQKTIEQKSTTEILEYARPTEHFLSELFRATAVISHKPENSAVLAEIGINLGRIIYLVDSCVDLLDDLEKREFNALLAAYANQDGDLDEPAGDQISDLIIESLKIIKNLVPRLGFNHHQELINNIIFVGLPLTIQKQLSISIKQLDKYRPALLKYVPHAAIAAALCIATPNIAEATVYGNHIICENGSDKAYSLGCSFNNLNTSAEELGCLSQSFDLFCNPCLYGSPQELSCNTCCTVISQAPKAFFTYLAINLAIKKKILPGFKKLGKEREQSHKDKQKQFKKNAFIKLEVHYNDTSKKLANYPEWNLLSTEIKVLFEKKLEKIFSPTTFNNRKIYASPRGLKTDIEKLFKELGLLDKKIHSAVENTKKLRNSFLKGQIGDLKPEVRLKLTLLKTMIEPSQIAHLIKDQRFDDIESIVKEIRSSLTNINNEG